MLHKHKWKETIKTYAPPIDKELFVNQFKFSGGRTLSETLSALLAGCTTVLRECEICSVVEKYEMLGKEEK